MFQQHADHRRLRQCFFDFGEHLTESLALQRLFEEARPVVRKDTCQPRRHIRPAVGGSVNGQIAAAEEELATLTPSPDADRRAEILAELAEKRPALETVKEQIASTTADYDGKISAAQAQKETLESQLAQYEATYEENLSQIEAQLSSLQAQLSQVQDGLAAIEEGGYIESYRQMQAALPE